MTRPTSQFRRRSSNVLSMSSRLSVINNTLLYEHGQEHERNVMDRGMPRTGESRVWKSKCLTSFPPLLPHGFSDLTWFAQCKKHLLHLVPSSIHRSFTEPSGCYHFTRAPLPCLLPSFLCLGLFMGLI